jgi:3-deoxy-D-manno-octulosonic acid (KDO) 8-phosphate synthase
VHIFGTSVCNDIHSDSAANEVTVYGPWLSPPLFHDRQPDLMLTTPFHEKIQVLMFLVHEHMYISTLPP